jgi:hypothetical protein
MLIDEIVHTCSNEHVAKAAVASIGLAFASRVKCAADLHGVSIGVFAARAVREFGEDTEPLERRAIDRAIHKTDQPILRGLQIILERQLEELTLPGRWRDLKRAARQCGCSA